NRDGTALVRKPNRGGFGCSVHSGAWRHVYQVPGHEWNNEPTGYAGRHVGLNPTPLCERTPESQRWDEWTVLNEHLHFKSGGFELQRPAREPAQAVLARIAVRC